MLPRSRRLRKRTELRRPKASVPTTDRDARFARSAVLLPIELYCSWLTLHCTYPLTRSHSPKLPSDTCPRAASFLGRSPIDSCEIGLSRAVGRKSTPLVHRIN